MWLGVSVCIERRIELKSPVSLSRVSGKPASGAREKLGSVTKQGDRYLRKQADVEGMERVRAAGGLAVFARLGGIEKFLTLQSQAIRNNDKLPNTVMSPEQKRQVIDGVYYGMMRTAQLGNTMWRKVEQNLK